MSSLVEQAFAAGSRIRLDEMKGAGVCLLKKNMSDILALNWEHTQVCGLDAEVSKAGVRVRKAFTLTWPEGKSPAEDAPAAGGWLNEQFVELGLTAKSVVVTIPREDAVVRVLEVPDVTDGELPNVVRFQAAAKSTRPLETQLLDFLPLPRREGVAGREVLVAMVGREIIDSLRLVLSRTGRELAGISLTGPAMVELLARLERPDLAHPNAVELAIIRHGQMVEISLLRQRGLLLTLSARLPDDAVEPDRQQMAVVAEVNRSLVALKRQHPELTLSRAWLWGDAAENRELSSVFAKRFGCDVRVVDPLTAPGLIGTGLEQVQSHGLFTGPVGMLLSQSERMAESLDFLHPRQAVAPRDLRKFIVPAVAASVLLLFAGAWSLRASQMSELQEEIANQKTKFKELDDTVKKSAPSVKSADTIQKWVDQRVVWLDRLSELSQTMEGTERVYVTKLNAQQGASGTLGAIRGKGFAKDRDDVENLNAKLISRDGLTAQTHEIKRVGTDGDYPWELDLDVSWKPVTKDNKAKAKPPIKK